MKHKPHGVHMYNPTLVLNERKYFHSLPLMHKKGLAHSALRCVLQQETIVSC